MDSAVAILITLCAVGSLAALKRRLPVQNIVAIAVLLFGLSALVEFLAANTELPFCSALRSATGFSWISPLLWIVLIIASRGLCRWLLQRCGTKRNFGFKLLGISASLAGFGYIAVGTFLGRRLLISDVFGAIIVSIILLVSITPWMIDKKTAQ